MKFKAYLTFIIFSHFCITLFSQVSNLDSILNRQLSIAKAFSNGMVLQRDLPINIWGWSTLGDGIVVKLNFKNQEYQTVTNEEGKWTIQLPAMSKGGPFKMFIQSKEEELILENILIGDVWLCAGQSNMGWKVIQSNGFYKEIPKAKDIEIRHYKIDESYSFRPESKLDSESEWKVCTPETVGEFSAIGYYFAKELRKNQNIPIGLLNASVGSTKITTWTSLDYQKKDSKKIALLNNRKFAPSLFYNRMIHPITQLPIKGVIWYQGESNASVKDENYGQKLNDLIENWRSDWGIDNLPFIVIQLHKSGGLSVTREGGWTMIRKEQTKVLKDPNVALVATIDIGGSGGHILEKSKIGQRVALSARHLVYKEDIISKGPMYHNHKVKENKVVIQFSNIGKGLHVKNKYGYVKGFAIAGKDKQFTIAEASLIGNEVIVNSELITSPSYLKYAWSDNPGELNLYNSSDLPAYPFKIDLENGLPISENLKNNSSTFQNYELRDGKVFLNFNNIGRKLKCDSPYNYVNGFSIAQEKTTDFKWVKAKLVKNQVVIDIDTFNLPFYIRYDTEDVNLFNFKNDLINPFQIKIE